MRLLPPPAPPRAWPARVALFMWTLPTNLIGHLLGLLATGARPRRIGGPRVSGWAYAIPWSRIGAVTFGDVVLHDRAFLEGLRGRVLLAHELAHVVQHRTLGPLYLAVHGAAQVGSIVRGAASSRGRDFVALVHAHNPLEQRWICLGFDACEAVLEMPESEREALLRAYGV